jgi:MoaA/NifB/PqqE/SkfB family radical SAM enzyme
MATVSTIDFHVTCECNQECAYCWGPQEIDAVDTATALEIVTAIARHGASRIVFTGGDPLKRADLAELIAEAARWGLEVAVSTTGDELTPAFLEACGSHIDLISLPLDGSCEEVSSRTKKPGHFDAFVSALQMLTCHPDIDVKVATPVTRRNLDDVPGIVELLDHIAVDGPNRLFYNVFQAFPRSMSDDVAWDDLVVTAEEFSDLRSRVEQADHPFRINWLDHRILDRLYVMIFPDGSLRVPAGGSYLDYGPFLEVDDLDRILKRTEFDAAKHRLHSLGWSKA